MATKKRKFVVVRTYSAGVHVGELVSQKGPEVVLAKARRIWYWTGARTLNEIANNGVGTGSKVSEPVSSIRLIGAIEILDTTKKAQNILESISWSG